MLATNREATLASKQSIYLGLKHRTTKAWRIAGVAAKLCLELGLHRERFFEDSRVLPRWYTEWKRIFACVYRLERQWSFYSGLPWTLHDREINVSSLTLVMLSTSTNKSTRL
jgi:hypothetical protein